MGLMELTKEQIPAVWPRGVCTLSWAVWGRGVRPELLPPGLEVLSALMERRPSGVCAVEENSQGCCVL